MKKYHTLTGRTEKLLFGAFLVVLLYMTRDTMFTLSLIGFYPAQFISLGVTAAAVLAFLVKCRGELPGILRDRRILWMAALSLILLVPMLIKRDWQFMYFSILICLYIAVFFTFFTSVEEVAGWFVGIITVLSLFSVLATYILRIPADRGYLVPQIFDNYFGEPFYNYGLSIVSISFVKNRNFGIFREPGVYQYFLLLAIYLNNYRVCWQDARKMWIVNGILAVTMLSTFATGGVIELGLFAVVLYLDKKWYRTRRGVILGISAVAGILAALGLIVLQHGALYEELYLMMEKFFNNSDSVTDRVGSIGTNLALFLRSPLWGNPLAATLFAIENNTSSSMILFAVFGVVGGGLNVLSWFFLTWDKERALWANLALTAILAMSFNTQNLITDPYFWMFPIMAMTDRGAALISFIPTRKKG